MLIKVYFTGCTENELKTLIDKLPVSHAFGDELSVLETQEILVGPAAHESYISNHLRKKTRVRTYVCLTTVQYVGGYGPYQRKAIHEHSVLVALVSVPDWSAKGLDIEDHVLVKESPEWPIPVGQRYFHGPNYSRLVYRDFAVAFRGLQESCGPLCATHKLWLKISPLAMGPSIMSPEKINLFAFAAPWYTQALAMAIQEYANSSWIHAIELVDFTGTLVGLANFLKQPEGVQIICPSNRDILDFTACPMDVLPACIAPIDSFCAPWKNEKPRTSFDSLASCIINNTNIQASTQKQFHLIELHV